MISSITLAEDQFGDTPVVLHAETGKRSATSATGLIAGYVSAPRDDKAVRPQAHGGINLTRFTDGGQPSFVFEVMGDDIEDCLSEFRQMVAPMIRTLDVGPALLLWTEGTTGLQLQRLVKLDSDIDPTIQGGAAVLTFPVTFYAEDPRAYSQTLSQPNATLSASLVTNATFAADTIGAAPAHWTAAGTALTTKTVAASGIGANKMLQLAISSLASGGTAGMVSDKFTVTHGVEYAIAIACQGITVDPTRVLTAKVMTYNSSGTLLTTTILSDVLLSGVSTVLSGKFLANDGGSSTAKATQAAIEIDLKNLGGSAQAIAANVLQVVCSVPLAVAVAQSGIRDTPPLVKVVGNIGNQRILFNDAVSLELTNQPLLEMLNPAAEIDIDFSTKSIIGNGFTGVANRTSMLSYLSPQTAVWQTIPAQTTTTISVLGALIGDTLEVDYRDAY